MGLHGMTSAPVVLSELSGAVNYYAPAVRLIRGDLLVPEDWGLVRAWQAEAGSPVFTACVAAECDAWLEPPSPRLPCDWQVRGSYRGVRFFECPAPTGVLGGPR
jgi:hypothetical protein